MPGRFAKLIVVVAVLMFGITACGQTGPLVLPTETTDEEEQSDEENER